MSRKEIANWIGYLAAINISIVQLPQIVKTFQEKDSSGLSLGMIILNICGGLLWFTYGILLNLPPVYGANILFLSANITLLFMKYRYDNKKDEDTSQEFVADKASRDNHSPVETS